MTSLLYKLIGLQIVIPVVTICRLLLLSLCIYVPYIRVKNVLRGADKDVNNVNKVIMLLLRM